MTNATGMAIGIDYGEITTGLAACLGMAKGMGDQTRLDMAMASITNSMTRDFGRRVDALGAEGTVAHVYEYKAEGNPAGRLWDIYWTQRGRGSRIGSVFFRPAHVNPPIPEEIKSSAAASGRTLARHEFTDKANHLENTRILVSVAGQQRHTRRIGGDVSNPRSLVFIDSTGRMRFATRHVRKNEFYGKFRKVFASYWVTQVNHGMKGKVARGYNQTAKYGRGRVLREINRARAASTPRVTPGMSGIYVRDMNRPFVGIRVRQADVDRVARPVGDRLRRELVRQWQRQ